MIRKAFKAVRAFLKDRPLCTVSTVLLIKDAALGLGFVLAPAEITQTLIYQNISMLLPAIFFGWFLLIVALLTAACSLGNKTGFSRVGLDIMALFWLFTAYIYILGGSPLLMVVALVFSVLAGYISFYYKLDNLFGEKNGNS